MKRVAFIGAAAAWTAANLTDEVLPGLLDGLPIGVPHESRPPTLARQLSELRNR